MRKPLRREFANACQEQTIAALDKSSDRISKIRHELAETDLTLVPLRIADNPVVSLSFAIVATFRKTSMLKRS